MRPGIEQRVSEPSHSNNKCIETCAGCWKMLTNAPKEFKYTSKLSQTHARSAFGDAWVLRAPPTVGGCVCSHPVCVPGMCPVCVPWRTEAEEPSAVLLGIMSQPPSALPPAPHVRGGGRRPGCANWSSSGALPCTAYTMVHSNKVCTAAIAAQN